jgi:hypothetical protein
MKITTDSDTPSWPTLIKFVLILAFVSLWLAYLVRKDAQQQIIDQCNKYERFHDGELRYFCRPWPYDESTEEDTEEVIDPVIHS